MEGFMGYTTGLNGDDSNNENSCRPTSVKGWFLCDPSCDRPAICSSLPS